MTAKLLFQLIFGVFSLKPNNMRWFNMRRIIVCIFLLPVFTSLLLLNNFFLLLDNVFFPHFYKQKTKEAVFIISAPRSATTYLFHALAKNKKFTYFKLWEIVFAPSICQKYLAIFALQIDQLIGSPIKRMILFLENLFIRRFKKIHLIGLDLPEEDEAVLLWSLSSLYLNFFYPDSNFFDDIVLFDEQLSARRKARIMKSYVNYVKRHNFVFNRRDEKQYLSKNPLMMCKVEALSTIYPDALILNINRSPAKTIPSTLELNRNLYALFTSRPVPKELNDRSFQILIGWYKMAEKNILAHYPEQHLKIDFVKLVNQEEKEIYRIAGFLSISPSSLLMPKQENKKHKSGNNYDDLSNTQLEAVLEVIPFMKDYC